MTSKDGISRRKLSLLELATELSAVSKACKVMGYSRQQFYEIHRNFQTYGADGRIDRLPETRGRIQTMCRSRSKRPCPTMHSITPAMARGGSNRNCG